MQFSYGSHSHATDEIDLTSFAKRITYSQRGLPLSVRHTMTVEGVVLPSGGTEAATSSAVATIENAYGFNGRDAILRHSDGTVSAHSMLNRNFRGGTRVLEISFPAATGLAYSVGRRFKVTIEGEQDISSDPYVSFKETVTRLGDGGPRLAAVEVANGPPQLQTTAQQTIVKITQTGTQVTRNSRRDPPPPLLRNKTSERITKDSPRRQGQDLVDYPTSWAYEFVELSMRDVNPNER